ncbi:MAG: tRNA (adenosine(37)-N6)-threonylcarbamoyltransferase complex dimerization subunit type 1 TsaB [Pseudomonadota bacterium]|nr:tRNA (adenosine(37)-N6)-threonylcarbamoyltransferase complex dimerization subunit type 1 TsaB [Pseudomonadota bacterium]MED5483959.1 tRNA (adenosine(37)-N6)-threonylcarbamoyltransferase complex dimerization subunit type 1 TsaB [Pseudomonadota bacterium]
MNSLIIDTTYGSCSASIIDSNMHCFYTYNSSNKLQSETITSVTLETFKKAKKDIKDISNLVVTNGPGNFTSIRVGVSFALGIAKGLSLPVYSISSLDLLSIFENEKLIKDKSYICVMPSRGNEFFVKVFEKNSDSSSDILKLKKADLENQFSKNNYVAVINSLQNEQINIENFNLIERNLGDMSLDLVLKIKNNNLELNKLEELNYFSNPSAEKVRSSWYMKKKK